MNSDNLFLLDILPFLLFLFLYYLHFNYADFLQKFHFSKIFPTVRQVIQEIILGSQSDRIMDDPFHRLLLVRIM